MESLNKNDLKDLKNFFKNRTKHIKNEKDEMLSIIGTHLETIDNSKLSEIEKHESKKELNDVGNFIRLFDDKIIIEEVIRTAPDFLVRKNKKLISIDVKDIYSDISEREVKTDKIFKEIAKELKETAPEIKGVYKIKFNESLFFKAEEQVLKNAIVNSIKNPEFKSEYIDDIEQSKGDTFYLLMDEISISNSLSEETIKETIAKKEGKLSEYKSSIKVEEFWLLLVLNDFKDYKSVVKSTFNTKYQKVFICDFSKSTISELKTR